VTGKAAFCVVNGVPVIGPCFTCRENALAAVRRVVEHVENLAEPAADCGVEFIKERAGPVTLQVTVGDELLARLTGLDELTLRRFKRIFKKKDVYPDRFCKPGRRDAGMPGANRRTGSYPLQTPCFLLILPIIPKLNFLGRQWPCPSGITSVSVLTKNF